ncbi:pyruvate kinase alpha/beta domain-containing protein [Thiovibrio sp. JS02]
MMDRVGALFEKPGPANTEAALAVMAAGLVRYGVGQVVVASTHGSTGLVAARRLAGRGINLVVVTHNAGFKEPGRLEMSFERRQEIEALGGRVHTGTMPFRNIGTAIREKQEYSQQDLVANTLRLFGQGVKVCVEITLMAADSGLISTDDVLAVAGTGRGADTVALLSPQSSNKLFSLRIKDILAKPLSW